jgi:hypothetical protein
MTLPPAFLSFYGQQYRCMACSAATSPNGVLPFVRSGVDQTLPVSHFGEICTAKIWLIPTNPKGDPTDSNVGFKPTGFVNRQVLTDKQVEEAFEHFSGYFRRPSSHSFFRPWIELLNGIELRGEPQSWEGGGICAVDLIKCPTLIDWGSFVRKRENASDKDLIYLNCFGDAGPGRFLKEQIDLHKPKVLVFADTASYLVENRRINKDGDLFNRWPTDVATYRTGVWTFGTRLSIGLGAVRHIRDGDSDLLKRLRDAVQLIIRAWEGR